MNKVKQWLKEKQQRGVKDVRVATVLAQFEEAEAAERGKRKRTNNGLPMDLDLVGTAEAADILEVERPRIGRWIKNDILPPPVARVAATPLWHRSQIETFKEEREKRRRSPSVA